MTNIPLTGAWLWEKFGKDIVKTTAKHLWTGFNWFLAAAKYQHNLYRQYAHIQIFGQPEPVLLEGMFTHVHILDEPTALQRYDIQALRDAVRQDPARFHAATRGLGHRTKKVDGLELVAQPDSQRLLILGKPGAGKTTFLKYLTIQAVKGKIPRIPIFISLKAWADSELDLIPFIARQFEICDFPEPQPLVELVLRHGSALVLFDGLDEVNREAQERMRLIPILSDFGRQYRDAQITITCRIAASDYVFEGFKYVELADFNQGQQHAFARKWFKGDDATRNRFWKEFKKKENRGLQELARIPLLLALLCLAFQETMTFPQRRVEIYEEALDALLKKWDTSRHIVRDTPYHKLSLGRKRQMFARLAAESFENSDYFFRQKDLETRIVDYLQKLPPVDREEDIDGTAVLKSIEAQHSILIERAHRVYAFAHLTFQEYFTAKYIVDNVGKDTLPRLLSHTTDGHWREVILLTASILDDADAFFECFLHALDDLVRDDEGLIAFLTWAARKASTVEANYRPTAIRSYYCALAVDLDLARTSALDLDLARTFALDLDLARTLDRALDLALDCASTLGHTSARAQKLGLDTLHRTLSALATPAKEAPAKDWRTFTDRLQEIMIEHCDIDHDWNFTQKQTRHLKRYFGAVELLVQCLNLAVVTDRAAIEDRLLLPPSTQPNRWRRSLRALIRKTQ